MNEGMMNLYTLHICILHFLFAFLFLRFKIMVMEVELIQESKKGQRGGSKGANGRHDKKKGAKYERQER